MNLQHLGMAFGVFQSSSRLMSRAIMVEYVLMSPAGQAKREASDARSSICTRALNRKKY